MIADLLAAWLLEFCAIVGHLALDGAVILAAMSVAALVFVAADRGARRLWRQARKRKKRSSQERQWAEFAAGHPELRDLITVTEDPDA